MVSTTPHPRPTVEVVHEEVDLDDWEADEAPEPTLTDGPDGQVRIYRHGYSVRVELGGVHEIPRICFESGWKGRDTKKGVRFVMRGSTFLTGRKPQGTKTPMAEFNKKHKSVVYSLAVESVETEVEDRPMIFVDIQGTRYADVDYLMKEVLSASEFHVAHHRVAERYIVLSPFDASILAGALQEQPCRGRGRIARKYNLIRDREIPITVRKRTKVTAKLNLYRIDRGATWVYKLEISLRGRTRDRRHFFDEDIARLDAILQDLVKEHGLNPLPKPSRWEPRDRKARVERGGFDPILRSLGQKAHTGYALRPELIHTVEKCHTLGAVDWAFSSDLTGAYPSPARIRSSELSDSQSPHRSLLPRDGYQAIGHELSRLPGCLSEVIIGPDDDPVRVVRALAEYQDVSLSVLSAQDSQGNADTWGSILQLLDQYPLHEEREVDVHVIVIDTNASQAVEDAVVQWEADPSLDDEGPPDPEPEVDPMPSLDSDEATWDAWMERGFNSQVKGTPTWSRPGPLCRPFSSYEPDPTDRRPKALAAYLWGTMREFRQVAEETDVKFLVITVDCRPDHAYGPLRASHRFRDARFRSHIGDAGRYWCHQRYRLEGNWRKPTVVALKDMAEGLTARRLWPMTG